MFLPETSEQPEGQTPSEEESSSQFIHPRHTSARAKRARTSAGSAANASPTPGQVQTQPSLFNDVVEFRYFPSVIGSGYEAQVAKLALEDGIAHRAARKNMQIHSAIVLTINGDFSGFMTFQNNHEVGEFCLLQSVIRPDRHTDELYCRLVRKVVEQNVNGYPAIMTTDPKSKFATPELFGGMGFQTYLKMSGFHYMVHGNLADVRMKLLAHITMCNVWDSVKGEWLRLKREWNRQIEAAGEKRAIPNPLYATRDGCWQGTNGFANVVTGHAHNGNASVLDPVACEVILRFFTPKDGRRVYNPFGGGVQFGFKEREGSESKRKAPEGLAL